MFRYEIPVDDREHEIELQSDPLHVEGKIVEGWASNEHFIEFWAEGSMEDTGIMRTFMAVGTGHPVPNNAVWRGTTSRMPGDLVWHLYELTDGDHV